MIAAIPLEKEYLDGLKHNELDILLVDLDEEAENRVEDLFDFLTAWEMPVLFNDSNATARSLRTEDREFGRKLSLKLTSLLSGAPDPSPWQH